MNPQYQRRRQMNAKRHAASLLLGVILAACGGTPASPAPAGSSPAPNPSPTASAGLPVPPPGASTAPIIAIAAGSWHTCAVTGGGGVKCWGLNAGELGDGTTIGTSVPVDVPGLTSGVSAITAHEDYTCALTDGGGVKCWGSNQYGQLGNGSKTDSTEAVDVSGLTSGVSAIATGAYHACALTDGGGVKCWGLNDHRQLGSDSASYSPVPLDVAGLMSGVSAIAAGGYQSCAVTTDGGVKCWGEDVGGWPQEGSLPVDVAGLTSGVSAVAAGSGHTCALTVNGGVKCWGGGFSWDGDVRTKNSATPVGVTGLTSGVSAISAGLGYTCALTKGGGVKCWGSNTGALPVEVTGLTSGVSAITAGHFHACALTISGGVKCWGSNESGQLGNDTMAESAIPVKVDFALLGPTLDASGAIVHATGPADVLLRYDHGPDRGELLGEGGPFAPGPEFTLYGDGKMIFRDETASRAPAKGGITRLDPFAAGRLTEVQVQRLLRFALTEGGLGIALPQYDTGGEGCADGRWTYLLRVGGIDKRVESRGCDDTFWLLAEHLRSVAAGSASEIWVPRSYWGSLLKASPLIKRGVLPKVPAAGAVPWPWPDIAPSAFAWHEDPALGSEGLRVLSADEAAALGLSDNGGVVQRVYLLGPDGATVYAFSLWPRFPDETN